MAIWICIFFPLFIVLFAQYQTKKRMRQKHILKEIRAHREHRKKVDLNMSEVVKRFVGKECIITTMNETVTGVVEAAEEKWIVISPVGKNTTGTEIVSMDYIIRIREYPRNKNGKKKAIVG